MGATVSKWMLTVYKKKVLDSSILRFKIGSYNHNLNLILNSKTGVNT